MSGGRYTSGYIRQLRREHPRGLPAEVEWTSPEEVTTTPSCSAIRVCQPTASSVVRPSGRSRGHH